MSVHSNAGHSLINTDITWVSPVPLVALLSWRSISSIPPISPRLARSAIKAGRTRDTGVASAQTGRDLVVFKLAGKMDLEDEE